MVIRTTILVLHYCHQRHPSQNQRGHQNSHCKSEISKRDHHHHLLLYHSKALHASTTRPTAIIQRSTQHHGKHMWDLKHDPEWNALPILQAIWDPDNPVPSTIAMKISKLTTKGLTMCSLKKQRKLTRTKLLKMDDWPLWKASEWKQLEAYEDQNTFDPPESLPNGSNLLSLIWTYMVKDDGRQKTQCICNGSKNMRGSVTMAKTYASALKQTGARLFWSACALHNYLIIGADTANAFAEAPPPKAPLYMYKLINSTVNGISTNLGRQYQKATSYAYEKHYKATLNRHVYGRTLSITSSNRTTSNHVHTSQISTTPITTIAQVFPPPSRRFRHRRRRSHLQNQQQNVNQNLRTRTNHTLQRR